MHLLDYIFLLIIKLSFGLCWTHLEKSYHGSKQSACRFDKYLKKYCPNLGDHAYKGQLINEPPKSYLYFLDDPEPYNEEEYFRDKRASKHKAKLDMSSQEGDEVEEDEDELNENTADENINCDLEKGLKECTTKNLSDDKKDCLETERESEEIDDNEEPDETENKQSNANNENCK